MSFFMWLFLLSFQALSAIVSIETMAYVFMHMEMRMQLGVVALLVPFQCVFGFVIYNNLHERWIQDRRWLRRLTISLASCGPVLFVIAICLDAFIAASRARQ